MSQTSKQQPRRRAPIVEISLIMMAVSLITLIILCLVPGAGKSTKNPVLAIYGDQGNFPSLSFTNTMHAAGFEYELLNYGNDLPDASDIVVVGVGEDAAYVINEYKNDPHVIGFVLICPEYNEDFLTGLSSLDPVCDVAIFAGRDNADNVAGMKDARRIYERISGDDTLFGIQQRPEPHAVVKLLHGKRREQVVFLSAVPERIRGLLECYLHR